RSAARSALVLALALAWFAMLLPSPAAAQPVSGPIPPPGQPPGQNSQPVMVGLPRLQLDATGALSVEPNVVVGPPGSEPPPPGLNASGKWAQPSAWERMAQRLSLMPTDEELLLT